MYRASLCLLLALALVCGCTPRPAQAQAAGAQAQQTPAPQPVPTTTFEQPLDKQSKKIMRVVLNAGVGGRLTVFLNNGEELHGAVSQIGPDSFALAEVDRHDVFTILYRDVRKARTGYDGINLFTGQRVSRSRGMKVAGLAIGLFAAVGLPLIFVAASRD